MHPQRRRAITVLGCLLGLVVLAPGRADAHAEIRETSPAPRAEVAALGPIDMIFWSEVLSGTLTVSDLDGEIRSATGRPDGDFVLRFEVEPVTDPGTYRIDVAYVSADGDRNARAWTVTVDEGGDVPERLTPPEIVPTRESGNATVTVAAGAVLFACTAVLVALVLRRARNRLDELEPDPEPTP